MDRTTLGKIRYLAIDLDEIWIVVHSGWRAEYRTALRALDKIREFGSLEELVLIRGRAPHLERTAWGGLVLRTVESLGEELKSCFIQATIQSDLEREGEKYPGWRVPLIRIVDPRVDTRFGQLELDRSAAGTWNTGVSHIALSCVSSCTYTIRS